VLADFIKYLTRKKIQIIFNNLSVNKPVSSVFGIDRGKPIDRYYIEKFLASQAEYIQGRVLEVGGSEYSHRFGGEKVDAFEVLHATPVKQKNTFVGDLTDVSTLQENAFDCFVCTQTLNFIYDVRMAVQGAHYLLKPGGVLLATVAGISQISRYDMERWGDYWRFTTASIKKLFNPVFKGGVQVETFGNVLAATAFLQGISVEDLPDEALLDANDPDYQLLITIIARKAF